METVMAFGTFDLIHLGHLSYLNQAKRLGKKLIVVVARDSSVKKIKRKNPLNNEVNRLKLVSALKPVGKAVLGDKKDFFKPVLKFRPQVIALGYDQEQSVKEIKEELKKRKLKARVVRLKPFRKDIHKTSKIKKSIKRKKN